MRLRSALSLWTLPLTLVGGCLLPSFENVPATVAEGGSGSGGEPAVAAGQAGEPSQAGTPTGGEGNPGGRQPELVADSYVVQQGKQLVVSAADGVLRNDTPVRLEVTAFSDVDKARPKKFNAQLEIAADGSLTFTPADSFFGSYVADYTATTPAGETATSTVTFVVQPTAVGLDAVADGVGGVLLSGGGKDALGVSLAPLGDVNADGFDDFAVGASGASDGYGSVYVVFGRPDFGALTLATPGSGEARFAELAGSAAAPISRYVSSAGRFDADKQRDIVVGSPDSDSGRLFVVYGGSNFKASLTLSPSMPPARGIAFSGVVSGSLLGLQVSGAGDFNGDNKLDLVAGLHRDGSTQGGLCLVLENPTASVNLDEVAYGVVPDAGVFDLPRALSFAGDVTGDGKDDVLASSARHVALLFGQADASDLPADISHVDDESRGLLRVRENAATGSAPVAALGDVNGDKLADFAYCDQFSGEALCNVFFGLRSLTDSLDDADWQLGGLAASPALPLLAPGADLNQDGFADLLLAEAGAAYVVFGRDAGFGAVDLASLGSDGFSLAAPAAGELSAVATIGDVNGDGFGDFAFGVPSAAKGAGQVYVVLGGPFAADQR